MNIFLREMKAHRKSLIFWSIGILFLVASGMGKFSAYSNSSQSMNELMSQMPKALQSIFGFGSLDLSKAIGYYGLLYLYLILMATIHAAMLGANIIAKEERDKTAEFLFVKPVSRHKIITEKLLAALTNIVIFNLVTLISSITIVKPYAKGEAITGDILTLMAAMFILQLMFLFIGTGIAAISKRPKSSTAIATSIILVAYILSFVIELNDKLTDLKYLTPFKYYEAKNLIFGKGFDPVFVTLSIIIIAVMFAVTYVFYKKRDLNV